jgi:hypothetical protein
LNLLGLLSSLVHGIPEARVSERRQGSGESDQE